MKDSTSILQLAKRIDQLISAARINDLAILIDTDRVKRVDYLMQTLSLLDPGCYVIGCGPYNCGVMKITVEEVTIGRPASPLEKPAEGIADILMNDAIWLRPREASRIHATIIRHRKGHAYEYLLRDESSTTGTYLNGKRIADRSVADQVVNPVILRSGDHFSLGPSGVNTFLFAEIVSRRDGQQRRQVAGVPGRG